MAGVINTTAVLNNGWNSGSNDQNFTGTIAIDPILEKNYDYALTSDPVLLQERVRTQENLYKIFKESPYFEKYGGIEKIPNPNWTPDSSDDVPKEKEIYFSKKIERGDIVEIFYYMKEQLDKIQKLNITELVMQINEFFDFNYDYIVHTVLSIPLKARLYNEIYKTGHKKIIDETESLF